MKDFYNICKDLQKILQDMISLDGKNNMDFDFRELPFEGYELDTKMYSDETEAWFNRIDNKLEGLHIYIPEEIVKENLELGQHKIIVAVEVFMRRSHYKTFLDLEDIELVSRPNNEESAYKKVADGILNAIFKDRKLEV